MISIDVIEGDTIGNDDIIDGTRDCVVSMGDGDTTGSKITIKWSNF